jgi:hypothetical protein
MPADSCPRSCREDHTPPLHSLLVMLMGLAEAGLTDTVPQMRTVGTADKRFGLARKQTGTGRIQAARIGMARTRLRIEKLLVESYRWQGMLGEQNPMFGSLVVFAREGIGEGQAKRGQR